MTISINKLFNIVNDCIENSPSLTDTALVINADQVSFALDVVDTEGNLPVACDNTGRKIFIKSLCAFRYSNGVSWTNQYASNTSRKLAFAWGQNHVGQLGFGPAPAYASSPTLAAGNMEWCKLGGHYYGAIGIKADGSLWTWGHNDYGTLGVGDVCHRNYPTRVGNELDWKDVSHGIGTNMSAIKKDGSLWSWGMGNYNAVGDLTSIHRSSPVRVSGADNKWCQAANGYLVSGGVKTDGTLWTWGYNAYGQAGDNTVTTKSSPVTTAGGGTNWCYVSSGYHASAGLKTDGTLWTWGYGTFGILGNGATVNTSSPATTAGGGTTWCSMRMGVWMGVGIKTDGTLWTWGCNGVGDLGSGTTVDRSSPSTTAGGGTTWCASGGQWTNNVALKTDGTLWTWGQNGSYQTGDGTSINKSSPVTTLGGGTTWTCAVNVIGAVIALKTI